MGLLDSPQVCTLSQKQTETLHYRCIFTHKYPSVMHSHSQISKYGVFSLTIIQVWCIFTHKYPRVVHFVERMQQDMPGTKDRSMPLHPPSPGQTLFLSLCGDRDYFWDNCCDLQQLASLQMNTLNKGSEH